MRVKGGYATRRRRKKIFNRAEGYRGKRKNVWRVAKQAVDRAGQMAYKGRKLKKRDFRRLWIVRINAEAREHGLSYSRLIAGLKKADIQMDRKVLADLALHEKDAFGALASRAKEALAA